MQRRPSLRAQHASELSRVGTSTRRAPRWFRGVRAPRVLRDDWTVASACPGTRTRASIEISRARRRRSTSCSDRDRLAPGRGGAGASWGRCIDLTAAFGKTPRLGVPPRCFPRSPAPGVLRDAPSTIPSQSQSGINYTIAYDDSGASTRLRQRASRFLKTSVRVCCALPSTIRAPHAHPPSPNSIPRHPHGDHRRRCGRCPRRPRCHLRPSRGRPGDARPHPNLPDDPLVRDPDGEDRRPSPRVTASGLERLREEVLANAVGAMRGDERAAVSAMVTATETAALHEAVRADAARSRRRRRHADADRTALAVVFHARRRLGLEAADATVSGLFGVGSAPARSGADPSQLSSGPDTAEALADVGYSAEAGWESLAAGATSEGAGAGASVGVARSTEIRPGIGEVRSAGDASIARARGGGSN